MNSLPQAWSFEWWEVFIGGVCTFAIFSFLYAENPFYRCFEHLFIGIATAYGIVNTVQTFFWPEVITPLFGLDIVQFPDGTASAEYSRWNLLYLLPAAFGLLYYCIASRRHNWLAQLCIGFSLGCSGGLAYKGTLTQMMPQIYNSFRPLYVPGDLFASATNALFVLTLLSTMAYFFFTFKHRIDGPVETISSIGRFLMMGCFGAFFGSTIMARMALLVERLNFLFDHWIPALKAIVSQ